MQLSLRLHPVMQHSAIAAAGYCETTKEQPLDNAHKKLLKNYVRRERLGLLRNK